MMIDLINLPSPRPLLPSLLEAGFSHGIASAASKLYHQRVEEFKRRTETTFTAAWQKTRKHPDTSASPLDPLTRKDASTFTEAYLRYLEEWKQEMVQLFRQASNVPSKAAPTRNSRSFNHKYLPLLEQFFEENPFPTHGDKVFLAKKSNMQYKQIHVWFQNRRSRTKKEAKPFRKRLILEGPMQPPNELHKQMKGHVVKPVPQPSQESLSKADDQLQITQNNVSECIFTSPPPPHAFPSSYPPACAYDPFPCKSGPISFERPEWRRMSCLKPLFVSISIDDLVERFSQLSVRDRTRTKEPPRLQSYAATVAITVIPSCAPHPSLMVHKQQHHPSDRAPTSCPRAFQSPSLTSKPVVPIPFSAPPHKSEAHVKGKTSSLPWRFRSRMQDTKRAIIPYCPSSSSSSRMSSAGSKSRSSSLSSVSSSSFSTNMASILDHYPTSPSEVLSSPHL